MFSSAQRGFKPISPIRLGTQDISIKDIQELIDYLGEHANSDPSRKLIEVLTDWLKSAGYPNPQPLLMIDQAMLQAIKEAMSTCLDILEYRRATNTKAVRYIHGVLQEVRVRAGKWRVRLRDRRWDADTNTVTQRSSCHILHWTGPQCGLARS